MKTIALHTKVRPKTGIITVSFETPHGTRTVSTGTNKPAEAKKIIKDHNLVAVATASKAGALSAELIQKLVVGRKLTVDQAVVEWKEWLESVCNSTLTSNT